VTRAAMLRMMGALLAGYLIIGVFVFLEHAQ
jgi:hypothetical protein